MQIKGQGFINFNKEYNVVRDKFMSASISDSYKNREGKYENGYINVTILGDNIAKAQAILKSKDHLVEYEGFTGSYYNGKPQFVITEINHKKAKSNNETELPF